MKVVAKIFLANYGKLRVRVMLFPGGESEMHIDLGLSAEMKIETYEVHVRPQLQRMGPVTETISGKQREGPIWRSRYHEQLGPYLAEHERKAT